MEKNSRQWGEKSNWPIVRLDRLEIVHHFRFVLEPTLRLHRRGIRNFSGASSSLNITTIWNNVKIRNQKATLHAHFRKFSQLLTKFPAFWHLNQECYGGRNMKHFSSRRAIRKLAKRIILTSFARPTRQAFDPLCLLLPLADWQRDWKKTRENW